MAERLERRFHSVIAENLADTECVLRQHSDDLLQRPGKSTVGYRVKRYAKSPKSERLQFSHHPGSPCNKERQGTFGPVEMRFWVSDHVRDPNHYAKEC